MSNTEIRSEIQKALESAPDSVLIQIYEFLQETKQIDSDKLKFSHNLNKILKEDKELLKKLSL